MAIFIKAIEFSVVKRLGQGFVSLVTVDVETRLDRGCPHMAHICMQLNIKVNLIGINYGSVILSDEIRSLKLFASLSLIAINKFLQLFAPLRWPLILKHLPLNY